MAFEYLANYVTFESVDEMDANVEQHIQQNYYDLTENERAVVFKLASHALDYPGACHLKADTIANALEISRRTVMRAIKKLEQFGIIERLPSTKLNGIKGANIYKILPFEQKCHIELAQRENADEVDNDAVYEKEMEQQPISFNLLKQAKTNNIYDTAIAEKEVCKEYMNEWQVMLYDFMHSLPLVNEFKDELHKLVLASQINDLTGFHKAKDVMINLANDIANGTLTITHTLRSVFKGAYSKAKNRMSKSIIVEEEPQQERPVPFYDWLNNRDINGTNGHLIGTKPNIENWLEW